MSSTENHPPSDDVIIALKTIVERVVRPVVTGRERKRAMREELLAHVTDVFDLERANVSSDAAALARTRDRLGDAGPLTADLQRAVSRWGRVQGTLQRANWGFWTPAQSTARFACKQGGILVVLSCLLFALMLTIEQLKGLGDSGFALRATLIYSALTAIFMTTFTLVDTRIGTALFGRSSERSWPLLVGFVLLAVAALPALAFFVYWTATGDVSASLGHLRFACYFAPIGPFMFYAAGKITYDEMMYEREWAGIELDE